jgi:predicted Zn finger-like uncharacterized protein
MKFVCERCHTKYSIADEKVRGKVLKVRCKTCANVITVRETGATIDDHAFAGPREPPIARSGSFSAGRDAITATPAPGVQAGLSDPIELPSAALFAPGSPALAPPRRAGPPPPPVDNTEWYLAIEGAQTGPFPRSRLVDKILAAHDDADVHVWNAGLDVWKPPKDVPELEMELGRRRRALTPVPAPPARPPSAPASLAASADGHGATSTGPEAGLVTFESGSHALKLPAPGQKKNGVGSASVPAPGGGEGGHAPLGFGDLLSEMDGEPTPVSAATYATPSADAAASPRMSAASPIAVPAVVSASVGTSVGMSVGMTAGKATGRQIKLLVGALAVVVVLCGIVSVWMLRRPSPTIVASSATPIKAPSTGAVGVREKSVPEAAPVEKEQPKPTTAPPVAEAEKPAPTRVDPPLKGLKGKPRRRTSPTAPPPLASAGATAEQRQAASRFGESTGRDVRLPTAAASAVHSTPAQGDISRVINNNRQGIQTCYQRALLRDNTLTHGKVTVRVSIGLSGKVKSVSLDAPAQFRALEPCIREVMSRWAFPPSSEEYGTEFPVVLQGNQ